MKKLPYRQQAILERIRDGLSPHIYSNSKRALEALWQKGLWEFIPGTSERALTDAGRKYFDLPPAGASATTEDP